MQLYSPLYSFTYFTSILSIRTEIYIQKCVAPAFIMFPHQQHDPICFVWLSNQTWKESHCLYLRDASLLMSFHNYTFFFLPFEGVILLKTDLLFPLVLTLNVWFSANGMCTTSKTKKEPGEDARFLKYEFQNCYFCLFVFRHRSEIDYHLELV